MRGVHKLPPPENVAPPEQDPRSLDDARAELLADLPGAPKPTECARNRYQALHKPTLRDALLVEQRELCVYCEAHIESCDNDKLRIDHWSPLSVEPEKALTWENLHLSCERAGTCDEHKKSSRLVRDATDEAEPDLPWPCEAPYQDWIGYGNGGDIYVRSDAPQAVRDALVVALCGLEDDHGTRRPPVLNLNHPQLVAARQAIQDVERKRIQSRFGRREVPEDAREAEAARLEAHNPYKSFVSVRIATWRGEIGKHR